MPGSPYIGKQDREALKVRGRVPPPGVDPPQREREAVKMGEGTGVEPQGETHARPRPDGEVDLANTNVRPTELHHGDAIRESGMYGFNFGLPKEGWNAWLRNVLALQHEWNRVNISDVV
ncbi:hypothetical protein ACFVVX_02925 [Kitasatospora sp. NPDC058170]|uniref:hypothetical protein n=1 Tax=Kitasatospora sp. NPDC058170 TaxID=3346364 RepID=UPI0036D9CE80